MENNKIERKDFRPAVRFAEWKIEREAAKREAARRKTIIMNEEKDRIAAITANAESNVRSIQAEAKAKKAKVEEWLAGEIVRIANEQADFEAELRNYIANIPAEERKALSFLEEGGVR